MNRRDFITLLAARGFALEIPIVRHVNFRNLEQYQIHRSRAYSNAIPGCPHMWQARKSGRWSGQYQTQPLALCSRKAPGLPQWQLP
jgi:hypothetical protein